jgi:hypothetical protein
VAAAERLVLCGDGYVSAANTLERTFADWSRQLAS